MSRDRPTRRLIIDDRAFLWSLRHKHLPHLPHQPPNRQCREVLSIRREGERGRLKIVFRNDPGHALGDGCHSGQVGIVDGTWLNLNLPGVIRALLEEALTRGWHPDDPTLHRQDGWELIAAVGGTSTKPEPRS